MRSRKDLSIRGTHMSETKGRTKTEKRVLRALFELQKLDNSSSGKLGTYGTLMEER
jgi:hypothetical protein